MLVMNPTDNSILSTFSPCSIKLMCAGIRQHNTCLLDEASIPKIQTGVCGNGVVESGEDCDCGLGCADDTCCNGATCKFKNGAQCDDMNDECCEDCQPQSSGTVCRKSVDFCTSSSMCDGVSGTCPDAFIQPDGKSCTITNRNNIAGTSCASGVCTSRYNYRI
jgi:hypothetical protein